MFVFRHTQDNGGGNVLHNNFLRRLISRRNSDLADLFAPGGVMRIIDRDTGAVFDSASGQAGVVSLARSIHENVELGDFRTMRMVWIAGGLDYAWTARVRNWGFGAARHTSGRVRIEFADVGVLRADIAVDADVYHALMRPQVRVCEDGFWRHDFLVAI